MSRKNQTNYNPRAIMHHTNAMIKYSGLKFSDSLLRVRSPPLKGVRHIILNDLFLSVPLSSCAQSQQTILKNSLFLS